MILYSIIYETPADRLSAHQHILASSVELAVTIFMEKYPDAHIKCVSVGDKTLMYEEANELDKTEGT